MKDTRSGKLKAEFSNHPSDGGTFLVALLSLLTYQPAPKNDLNSAEKYREGLSVLF